MTTEFLRDQLDRYRGDKLRRMLAAVNELGYETWWHGDWQDAPALQAALLHHSFYALQRAVKARDSARIETILEAWAAPPSQTLNLVQTVLGPVATASAKECERIDDVVYEEPIWLVTPGLSSPTAVDGSLAATVTRMLDAGPAWLVASAAPRIVVVLASRPNGSDAQSYSLLGAPGFAGTVFTDWASSIVRLGEYLLHESAHSWLNEVAEALGETWPETPMWYSPWRAMQRPVFGIVHGVLAHAVCAQYHRRQLDDADFDECDRAYCARALRTQISALDTMRTALPEALEHVASGALRHLIASEHSRALALRT